MLTKANHSILPQAEPNLVHSLLSYFPSKIRLYLSSIPTSSMLSVFPSGFLTKIVYAICTKSHTLFILLHTKYGSQIIQFSFSSDPRLSTDQVSYPYLIIQEIPVLLPLSTAHVAATEGHTTPAFAGKFEPVFSPLQFKLTHVAAELQTAVIQLLRWPGACKKHLSKCDDARVF